jgi:PEP-CTERM motif
MRLGRFSLGVAGLAAFIVCVPAYATVTYTCDPSITGNGTGQLNLSCSTLNTTLSTIYNSAFSDASASIYITLSTTSSLGENVRDYSLVSYSNYLAALKVDDPGDPGLASLPNTNPYGTGDIALTNALIDALPALGITPTGGILDTSTPSDFIQCALGTTGCFDAVLWVNDQGSTGNLWLRSGTEGSGQYDFYSVVEHETDEILGTGSCVANGTTNPATDGCQNPATIHATNNNVSAADLFRYTCGSTSRNFGNLAASACFSVDGGNTDLKQYNNTNNGDDYGDWATSCANVQDAIGCLGPTAGYAHDIAANAEIELLNAAGFSLASGVPEPATFVLVGAALLGAGWLMRRKRR